VAVPLADVSAPRRGEIAGGGGAMRAVALSSGVFASVSNRPNKTLPAYPRHQTACPSNIVVGPGYLEPEPEPDFFTIAVSIATIRRRIARPACDDRSVGSERARQGSKIAADSVAERLAIRWNRAFSSLAKSGSGSGSGSGSTGRLPTSHLLCGEVVVEVVVIDPQPEHDAKRLTLAVSRLPWLPKTKSRVTTTPALTRKHAAALRRESLRPIDWLIAHGKIDRPYA
jgi:hypothetical protein